LIKLELARTKDRIKRFTSSIIKNHLYVKETWGIYTSISSFQSGYPTISAVILARDTETNEIVGCCMFVPKHAFTIQTFVKKSHRRKRIGTSMLKKMRKAYPAVNFVGETLSRKNKDFYRKMPRCV
jgi:hypothetical protein